MTKRQLDFYPTPPWATQALIDHYLSNRGSGGVCWEPAAGTGDMAEVLATHFDRVLTSDIEDYGKGYERHDFLSSLEPSPFVDESIDWVITNPPFSLAESFIRRCLLMDIKAFALIARIQLLEGKARYKEIFSKTPPSLVLVFSERVQFHQGEVKEKGSGAQCFAWFIWDRDVIRLPFSKTTIRWIPPRGVKNGKTKNRT